MKIIIRAFSAYQKYLPQDTPPTGLEIEVNDGITIEELLLQTGIPLDTPKIFTINDSNQKPDCIMHHGDVLKIFPMPMGG